MGTGIVLEKPNVYKTNQPDYDGLWKKVIEDLFEEFMQFFAPELWKEIDFNKTPDFLRQELYKEIIEEKKGKNVADQIVKVSLKNGKEKWILIHIEVQGKAGQEFSERMFRYFYRIYDRFNKEVYAIALLTDDKKSKYPGHFQYSFFGTKVEYAYNNYKFHDHEIKELEQLHNPFASVVIAGKYANKYKDDTQKLFNFKRKLMMQILKRFSPQYKKSRTYISALFYFIDYLLQTPDDLALELRKDLIEFVGKDGEQQMHTEKAELSPTLAGIFEELEKRGKKEGKKEGVEEAKRELAVNLIKEGFSDKKTADLTGLEQEAVVALRKELRG